MLLWFTYFFCCRFGALPCTSCMYKNRDTDSSFSFTGMESFERFEWIRIAHHYNVVLYSHVSYLHSLNNHRLTDIYRNRLSNMFFTRTKLNIKYLLVIQKLTTNILSPLTTLVVFVSFHPISSELLLSVHNPSGFTVHVSYLNINCILKNNFDN